MAKTYIIITFCCILLQSLAAGQISPRLTVPRGHKDIIRNCYYTPNDKYLVSTDDNRVLSIWDGDDGRQIFVLRDSTASFKKIEFDKTSSYITALTDEGKLYMIQLATLKTTVIDEQVKDYSMLENGSVLFYTLRTPGLYHFQLSNQVKKLIPLPSKYQPGKIIGISSTSACFEDQEAGVFLVNILTGKLTPVKVPGMVLTLEDFQPQTNSLLCSGKKDGTLFYFNLDARTGLKKSQISLKGNYPTYSCLYTSKPFEFLSTALLEDEEGQFITGSLDILSFSTGKKVIEIDSDIINKLEALNIGYSRKYAVVRQFSSLPNPVIYRFNFSTYKEEVVPIPAWNESSFSIFTCANQNGKVAMFSSDILLPVIINNSDLGINNGIKKYNDLRIHFTPVRTAGANDKRKEKISFLLKEEIAINDSVILAVKPYDSKDSFNKAVVYFTKNGLEKDSLTIFYDHMARALQGADYLFFNRGNKFYTVDFKKQKITDSLSFDPRVKITDVSQAGDFVLIRREDSLATPTYGILKYNIPDRKITGTDFVEDEYTINPYQELYYSHLTQGMFGSMTVRDQDLLQNTLFEYPFHYRVDTIAVYDSNENMTYKAVRDFYFKLTTGTNTTEPKTRSIAEKFPEIQIQQVRYWDRDCYVVMSRENKIFLYSVAMDSVFKSIDIKTSEDSRLFVLRNKQVLISNLITNDSYIINMETFRVIAHLTGIFNPAVRQPENYLLLQDASFGNYNIYTLPNYKSIATVTGFSKSDYVVTTATGLFDGTDNAIDNLYFVINDKEDIAKPWKTIDLKQLKAKYYIPNLWDKLMSGDTTNLPNVESIRSVSFAPEITTDTSWSFTRPYKINIIDKGGGIGAVRIVINGKEVIADARKNAVLNGKKMSLSVDLYPFKEYFSEGRNSIQVFSSNKDSSLTSRGVITSSSKTTSGSRPRLFVISIGTSDYKGKDIDLQYSSKDATDMAVALKTGAYALFSADSTITYLLTSTTADSTLLPSKSNIEKVFKQVAKTAAAKDVIVLYLSGHGINAGGDFCYLTKEAYTADPAAYRFKEILQAVTITSKEFTEYFTKITARKQLLIIDACASGKVVENLIAHRDIPYSTLKALDRLKDRTGTHVITGCAADAVSYEASRYGQGLLTYSLLEGMKGASLREDKFLDVVQWFQYARERVPQLANGLGGIQTPQVYSPTGNQSFDIALLDEERKKQIPLAAEKPIFIKSLFQDEDRFADHLQLGKLLDNSLTERSAGGSKGNFVFFPVDGFPGAYQLMGRYKISGKTINASVRVFKSSETEPISSFTIKADDVASLANAIFERISELK